MKIVREVHSKLTTAGIIWILSRCEYSTIGAINGFVYRIEMSHLALVKVVIVVVVRQSSMMQIVMVSYPTI
jgi:hypothetical protein